MIKKFPPTVMTVDPGLGGTGWAMWMVMSEKPFLPKPPSCWGVINESKGTWQERAIRIQIQFDKLTRDLLPDKVIIEMPELWTSGKSMASATSGDLLKLVYLIGSLATQLTRPPELISPRDWKGQLDKPTVIHRITKVWPGVGRSIGNHEADAVGMGLAIQGGL